jgi:hypothetical protein
MKLEQLFEAKKLKAFHGTGKLPTTNLRPPIFVTLEKSGARWYAIENSGNGEGVVLHGELSVNNPLDDGDLFEMAERAGVDFSLRPYFYCKEIAEHSEYDGSNPIDLVYVPRFVAQLKKEGYDSLHVFDALENEQIEAYILFDPDQFKIKGHSVVKVDK